MHAHRKKLLGIRGGMRGKRHLGLSGRSVEHHATGRTERTGTRRRVARPIGIEKEGYVLLCPCRRLPTFHAYPRTAFRIRPCRERRECRRRKNSHSPHLRLVRSAAVCVIPPLRISAHQRPTYPQGFGHGRPVWQHRKKQCFHIGCRSRMSGRSGRSLCHGGCGRSPVVRRHTGTNRICSRNGIGTPFGTDLRSRLRFGANPLHRAQCLCRRPCHGCQFVCHAD